MISDGVQNHVSEKNTSKKNQRSNGNRDGIRVPATGRILPNRGRSTVEAAAKFGSDTARKRRLQSLYPRAASPTDRTDATTAKETKRQHCLATGQ